MLYPFEPSPRSGDRKAIQSWGHWVIILRPWYMMHSLYFARVVAEYLYSSESGSRGKNAFLDEYLYRLDLYRLLDSFHLGGGQDKACFLAVYICEQDIHINDAV